MSLLIIDDDPIYRFSFKKIVASIRPDIELDTVNDGQEAIRYFNPAEGRHKKVKLILVDLNMPVMDGWGFLDAYRLMPFGKEHISVYIVSSSSNPSDLDRSEEYPEVSGYLVKPIKREALLELLEKL